MFAPDLAQYTAPVALTDLDQRPDRIQGRGDVPCLLGDDHEVIVLSVFGKRDPEAVENPRAQRRQQPQTDSIFVGENRVAVRFDNLQLVHPSADGGEEQCLTAGKNRRAPGEQLLPERLPSHRRSARTNERALTAAEQKAGNRED